ncbi:hypothetical protein DOTSEDRAFT_28728 [Dothistroma septosporum NZE10]|uniref:Uncharacterized protein n=1 Tax=Dothistroma septosporum (strain NZE10 / CBS 128990) TaxID=675120 RepID=M2Y2T0_DOTSN|nr:hypothetical protein DOTSEDRAFT_28728 [Dothistroma septosporum NZE10]
MVANQPTTYKARRFAGRFSSTRSTALMFKAHRFLDEDPNADQIQVLYCMPGPSDTFTVRYISRSALLDPRYWLSSPVSSLLGYPLKLCITDMNDILQPAYSIQEADEPLCHVANRFMTICDVRSDQFGEIYGFGALRGMAVFVCEDGTVPDLGYSSCANAYVKKWVILVGNEVERLRKRGNEEGLRRYREEVRDVFGDGAMRSEWEEWQRRETEQREKFERDRMAAEAAEVAE